MDVLQDGKSVDEKREEIEVNNCQVIPFGNGEWVPVVPEDERDIYWWSFPWARNVSSQDYEYINNGDPRAVWKFVAGKNVTHLPEQAIHTMTTHLCCKVLHSRRRTPKVVDFGQEYESVLDYFTERMLGIQDDVPEEKHGLLSKLFERTGFKDLESTNNPQPFIGTVSSELLFTVQTTDVDFGNGEWIPVIPEPEEQVYWWTFPWRYRRFEYSQFSHPHHKAAWKLISGNTITHLPAECIIYMTPGLASKSVSPAALAPQVIDFGSQYESVLEYFTERMLGIDDFIPDEKLGLLNKLFDATGYLKNVRMYDRFGNEVLQKYPI